MFFAGFTEIIVPTKVRELKTKETYTKPMDNRKAYNKIRYELRQYDLVGIKKF